MSFQPTLAWRDRRQRDVVIVLVEHPVLVLVDILERRDDHVQVGLVLFVERGRQQHVLDPSARSVPGPSIEMSVPYCTIRNGFGNW